MTPKRIFALIMGAIALARGYGYINPDRIPDGLITLSQVPGGLGTWGWVWIICGAIAVAGAFTRHTASPLIPFAVVNLLWGGSYLLEWLSVTLTWNGWTPSLSGEASRDWITTLSYFGLAAATLTVIRLVDPEEVKPHPRGQDA